MSQRLKKIAETLSTRLGEINTPQDTFDNLRKYSVKMPDFFSLFQGHDFIKLTLYIYSYYKTQNFDLAQSMMNNLTFLGLLTTEGNESSYSCQNCGGDGTNTCYNCDGDGEVDCDTCDGDGVVKCDTCDGNGEDEEGLACAECQGGGELECNDCEGSGKQTCNDCGGDGYSDCYTCDGMGEEKLPGFQNTIINFICTWDKELIENCINSLNKDTPATSEFEYDSKRDEMIIIHSDEEPAQLSDFVEENEVYCFYVNDEPKLTMKENSWFVSFAPLSKKFEKYIQQWGT